MSKTINFKDLFERKDVDGENNEVICTLCEKTFTDTEETALLSHLYVSHTDESGQLLKGLVPRDAQIWEYFKKSPDNERVAECQLCERTIKFSYNISCLKQHLRTHPREYEKYVADRHAADPVYFQLIEKMPTDIARWYSKGSVTKYFEYVDFKQAKCTTCKRTYGFQSTVGNLKVHLKKCHPRLYRQMLVADGLALQPGGADTDDDQECSRDQQTIDLGDYFDKYEDEDESMRCSLCKKSFSEREGEDSLVAHLFTEHARELEAQNALKRSRPSNEAIWDFFEVVDKADKVAKCKFCEQRGSYEDGCAELAIHLSKAHPDHFDVYLERNLEAHSDDDPPKRDYPGIGFKPKLRKNTSPMWKYFEKWDKGMGRCLICGSMLSYRSTTNNLKQHLRRRHPDHYREYQSIGEQRLTGTGPLYNTCYHSK